MTKKKKTESKPKISLDDAVRRVADEMATVAATVDHPNEVDVPKYTDALKSFTNMLENMIASKNLAVVSVLEVVEGLGTARTLVASGATHETQITLFKGLTEARKRLAEEIVELRTADVLVQDLVDLLEECER